MSEPIKVLAVVSGLNPGGLENRLMDILRIIDVNRVTIDVFTYNPEPCDYDEEVQKLGGTVYYNPRLTIFNMFWYVRYFRDFLKLHPEYGIVHAHQNAWCSVFCKGAFLAEVPVRIAHSRTAISSKTPDAFVKNLIKLPAKKYATHYFAVSQKAARWLFGDRMLAKNEFVVWPNAINAESFHYDPQTRDRVRILNDWSGKYVVMHVGNFTPPKNHPFILKIFKEIHSLNRDAVLVLVGNGTKRFKDGILKKYGLSDAIRVLGTRNDISDLLQGADVFLFPSIYEGLPGALVEAQAAGLPCVLADTIAEEVYITPNLTILPLSADAKVWAESVLKYRDFERDDTRQYIEDKGFDVHSLTERLCRFYEQVYREEVDKHGIS